MITCNWSCWRIDQVSMNNKADSFMSFGREVRLPVDVMFGGSEIRKTQDEYVDDVRRNMENAYHEVRERTKAVQKRQEDYYNKRVSGEPFKKDDRVWVHQPCTGRPSQGNSINHGLVHTESSKEYQIRCIVFS